MRRLLIVLVVLLVLVVILAAALAWADVEARRYAEDEAEQRLAAAVPEAKDVAVEIDGFPFVGGVLLWGEVEGLTIRLESLRSRGLDVELVELRAEKIQLDRDRLLDKRQLAITGVGRVSMTGRIDADEAARLLGVPVHVDDGVVHVRVEGRRVPAKVAIAHRTLQLSVKGLPPMTVPLPEKRYLPCDPRLRIEGRILEVSCSTTELPSAVRRVLAAGV